MLGSQQPGVGQSSVQIVEKLEVGDGVGVSVGVCATGYSSLAFVCVCASLSVREDWRGPIAVPPAGTYMYPRCHNRRNY